MSQLAQYLDANILVLSRVLAEGFYQSVEGDEVKLELTPLMAGDEIVFNTTDKTLLISRGGILDNRIRWARGDDKFWLGSNQTEDFLIVARFIGLMYKLRLEVFENDHSRVFARFV